MLKAFDFCDPTRGTKVPSAPDWLHEITYDGYRLRVERNGDRVRLITRNGYDWTDRYPWIVESALKNRIKQFVIDGEAVVLGVDGIPDFNALHSRQHEEEVQLYAFDIMALDGEDLRALPLSLRKTNLARLLARRPDGIFVAPFEQGEIAHGQEARMLELRAATDLARLWREAGAPNDPRARREGFAVAKSFLAPARNSAAGTR
jgi:bifunctional non-homologous end joining protein LigD